MTVLAVMIGHAERMRPYASQRATPQVKSRYMRKEMSLVCLVFQICQTCGTKEMVVSVAAQ